MDYRDIGKLKNGPYDRVYALGFVEHIGYQGIEPLLTTISANLVEGGVVLFQTAQHNDIYPHFYTIDRPHACYFTTFVHKHIFPGGCMLNPEWTLEQATKVGLVEVQRELFGPIYARTLRAWHENLIKKKDYVIKKYDERLYRTFRNYLAECEGAFRARAITLLHHVFVKEPKNSPLAHKKLDDNFWKQHLKIYR